MSERVSNGPHAVRAGGRTGGSTGAGTGTTTGRRRRGSVVGDEGFGPVIRADGITKSFRGEHGRESIRVLSDISLQVDAGEMVAIVGPSGSGKSTLLYCLAGLETCDSGTVDLMGHRLGTLSRGALAKLRRDHVGFVFQSFNLVPSLSARENIALPARLSRRRTQRAEIDRALADVGLLSRSRHLPGQLSGGQQQRVAVARVLAMRPSTVFADEPTGALDTATGADILRLLRGAADGIRSVVIVTHDLEAAARADRVLVLRDGVIHAELRHPTPEDVLEAVTRARELV